MEVRSTRENVVFAIHPWKISLNFTNGTSTSVLRTKLIDAGARLSELRSGQVKFTAELRNKRSA